MWFTALLDLMRGMVPLVGLACVACAGPTLAVPQSSSAADPRNQSYNPGSIRAYRDGVELVISARPGLPFDATLITADRRWEVTPTSCPAYADVLGELADVPPLTLGPWRLRNHPSVPVIAPASTPHAPWWEIEMAGRSPDQTQSRVVVHGSQDPYARWVTRVVAAIQSC